MCVFRQSVRQDAPTRPCTDDDVVIRLVTGKGRRVCEECSAGAGQHCSRTESESEREEVCWATLGTHDCWGGAATDGQCARRAVI